MRDNLVALTLSAEDLSRLFGYDSEVSKLRRRSLLISAAAASAAAAVAPHSRADNEFVAAAPLNVRDFGAVGDGRTDDTDAIEAAFAASDHNGPLYFPSGNFLYTGTGLDAPKSGSLTLLGEGRLSTMISLAPSSYFVNYSQYMVGLAVSELTFLGGKGAIKHTYAGVNVQQKYIVQNCRFKGYSECAIASDSVDMPYWIVQNCMFDAENTSNAIGIALGYGTDQCVIDSCSFIRNRVHIKARAGNNFHVSRCDFLQFSEDNLAGGRVGVWIVPKPQSVNSGTGMTITGSKFGNENLLPGDLRILYADEDNSGGTIGARLPRIDADSAGYIRGHNITQNAFYGTGANSHPLIFSTTPNVWDLQVHHNVLSGGQPSSVLEFRTQPTSPDRLAASNTFGPFTGTSESTFLPFPSSNADGVGFWQDPQGAFQSPETVRNWASGTCASFREVLSARITSFSATSASVVEIADAFGGLNAVALTLSDPSATLTARLGSRFVVGMPTWVEFDVANSGDGRSAAQLYVMVCDSLSILHLRRCVAVPTTEAGWMTYSFCFNPRTPGDASTQLAFRATGESEAGKVVNLGRPRVYQANERQVGGIRPGVLPPAVTERDAVGLANDIREKLVSVGILSGKSAPDTTGASHSMEAPEHRNSPGIVGQLQWDSRYLYVCVESNSWRRIPLSEETW